MEVAKVSPQPGAGSYSNLIATAFSQGCSTSTVDCDGRRWRLSSGLIYLQRCRRLRLVFIWKELIPASRELSDGPPFGECKINNALRI
jgi:hypothetical protein